MKYYSPAVKGFFDDAMHGKIGNKDTKIPSDAVLVSDEDYDALFASTSSEFKIAPNSDGYPVLTRIDVDNRPSAKSTRITALKAPIDFEGMTFQVDAVSRDNMRNAIEYAARNNVGADEVRNWVLADNTVKPVTAAILAGVLDAYTLRMDSIYGQYVLWMSGDMSDKFTVLETN